MQGSSLAFSPGSPRTVVLTRIASKASPLGFSLKETQEELFRLRFQAATEKLDAPSNLRKLRRNIARIRTIQRQRETKKV